ncbi:MAG: pyridoxal-phosphate dependent enzyme [Dehalococcoidia bacterium]|nr:pyridoxal-phosphate dependent enzyme [Dehalococcoidia bacterium]
MEDGTVSFDDIAAAQVGLAGHVRETPVWPFRVSSPGLDTDLLLKCEHMQVTGSFKIRGALNFVHNLDDASAQRGLVAMSAGNHAQGVALAARSRGASATIVVPQPRLWPRSRDARPGRPGRHPWGILEEARAEAFAIADREGRIFVPPFDDDAVIAGQGTVGLELVRQAPDVNEVLVPAGGGGLLAGVALALKHLRPGIRVIGVQSAAMDGIARSLAAGKPVAVGATRTIADGVAVSGPSERTFALIQRYVDEAVTVPDEAIAQAILAPGRAGEVRRRGRRGTRHRRCDERAIPSQRQSACGHLGRKHRYQPARVDGPTRARRSRSLPAPRRRGERHTGRTCPRLFSDRRGRGKHPRSRP